MDKASEKNNGTSRNIRRPLNINLYLIAIPLLISLCVAALFYPGFMSYDTIHALRGARNGVIDSAWPPMVSYVWRAVDLVSLNPSAMHFSQVFVLLISIFYITYVFTKRIKYASILLLVYVSIPVILGSLAVIWKDVLMAAFLLAGFASTLILRLEARKWRIALSTLISVILLFLGVCSRHNAMAGAVPLLFYLSFLICSRILKTRIRLLFGATILCSILTATLFSAKTFIDNYSLPDLKRMENSTQFFIRSVRIMDVAGASLCVGNNLFAEMAPNMTMDEIRAGYHPQHISMSMDLVNKVGIDSRIDKIWLSVATSHPLCFLNNKFLLTRHLIGANNETQFIITAPYIMDNEYGYTLAESRLRNLAVSYIVHVSWLPFLKPWFLYLLSIVALIYTIRIKALTAEYLALYSSAAFYFASLVLFGNAADGRLTFYTTTVIIMLLFVSHLQYKKNRQAIK